MAFTCDVISYLLLRLITCAGPFGDNVFSRFRICCKCKCDARERSSLDCCQLTVHVRPPRVSHVCTYGSTHEINADD